jgi:hypothetical protein
VSAYYQCDTCGQWALIIGPVADGMRHQVAAQIPAETAGLTSTQRVQATMGRLWDVWICGTWRLVRQYEHGQPPCAALREGGHK